MPEPVAGLVLVPVPVPVPAPEPVGMSEPVPVPEPRVLEASIFEGTSSSAWISLGVEVELDSMAESLASMSEDVEPVPVSMLELVPEPIVEEPEELLAPL